MPTTTNPVKQTQSIGYSPTIILVVVLFIIGFFIYENQYEKLVTSPSTTVPTVYSPGILPIETYAQTPKYGVPVPGNNYHGS
ncbi:hypothetical protein F8M41_025190 [Gigaspora margarita]|uniref:Uncharacterized protein n=1 Tax=Gigaspora margarita TaxID=4874 RepID=A0A8H4B047_GIGMA|nr:hypothetical protein F8M41_025190 [Gigaspora margarita]